MLEQSDVLAAVKREITLATDDQNEREENRVDALAYFRATEGGSFNSNTEDGEDEGISRSAIVSTDVADAVEAVLAEIVPAFAGQNPVEFVPLGPEDEEQADLESRATAYVASQNGAYMAFNASVKDALLRRAGVIKVHWQTIASVQYETQEGIDPMMLPELLADREDSVVEIDSAEEDPQTGLISGTVRRYTKKSRPRLEAVPLDQFLCSSNQLNQNMDEARFTAHRRPISRDELVRMGITKDEVYALTKYDSATDEQSRARERGDYTYETGHESTELVMVCESYYRIDEDDDGIAELRRIVTAGGSEGDETILIDEPWDEQPFAVGVPYLGIYTWDGISLFDKLKNIQDVKTDIIRGLLDVTERNLQQRIGVLERQANFEDVQTSVMGGAIRMKTPNAVFALPEVQINPQIFQVLGYMDEMRSDKGGSAIDSAAQAQSVAGDTAHGLERTMSAIEAVNAMVAKNLCETLVIPTYRKLHALLRKYQGGDIQVPANGQWLDATPGEWDQREDMVIAMGMSVGERGRRGAALGGVLAAQTQLMEKGFEGILVDNTKIYNTLTDMARMGGLPMPEQYYIHPESPEATEKFNQNQQEKQQQAQQAQQDKQVAMQFQQAQLDMLPKVEQIKAQAALDKQEMVNQVNAMKAEWDHIAKMFSERVKLVDLNAKYDAEPVPDTPEDIAAMDAQSGIAIAEYLASQAAPQ